MRVPVNPYGACLTARPLNDHWLRDHLASHRPATWPLTPLYPHRLRHTCATRLLNAGMDIVHIQNLLGHEHLTTTMIYARVQDATVENDFRQAIGQIERRLDAALRSAHRRG